MSSIEYDLEKLYQKTFGSKPYHIDKTDNSNSIAEPFKINGSNDEIIQDDFGNTLATKYNGVEIWLPTKLRGLPVKDFDFGVLDLPYTVIRITGSSTIIKTPLQERRGSVKELYSIDDYKITLKGFLIDKARQWPLKELDALRKVHEAGNNFYLDNALTNIFLAATDKVVLTSFELPEVEGGRKHVRPFIMQLESDSVFELVVSNV